MSANEDNVRQRLIGLCQKALEGVLPLTDFRCLGPSELGDDPFFAQVYSDIEDGVEHLPGFALRPGIDWDAWRNSDMYWALYLDCALLSENRSTSELLPCRKALDREKRFDETTIKALLTRCLSKIDSP